MKEFHVWHKNGRGYLTVYGPSLEYVGEIFPKANIFDANDLSQRLIRYESEI